MGTWHGRRQSRLFVPSEACGLLDAVAEACAGRDDALVRWERDARPGLALALARSGLDPASAEEVLMHLQEQAFHVVQAGRRIAFEPAWMRAVLANAWVASRRSLARDRARSRTVAERTATASRGADVNASEAREELDVATGKLPHRFALAIRLRLRGLTVGEVRASLAIELQVGEEMARKIDSRALALLRSALSDPSIPDA
ncbi:MAG: hypothetical protein K8T90_18635 [Planctomycetes bacterium]|nr:hypothetical protein [Planctomycetota bacterium]